MRDKTGTMLHLKLNPARHRRHCRDARAFTLLELLVVVAIISMLIAILLPTLRQARTHAKRMQCLSNLREITKAWHMYLHEHDGHFLQGIDVNMRYGGQQGTAARFGGGTPPVPVAKPLNPYLDLDPVVTDGAGIYHCPCDRGAAVADPTCFEYYGTSYNTNLFLIGQDQRPELPFDPCRPLIHAINERLKNLTASKVTVNPADLLLIGDFGWWTSYAFNDRRHFEWHEDEMTHCMAFLDGHAEPVRFTKGLHVAPCYAVIPFAELIELAADCQE